MNQNDLRLRYASDAERNILAERLKTDAPINVQLKGLVGSMDAVLAASIYPLQKQTHVFILHDKEEAAYFHQDLLSLLDPETVLLFPSAYKRPHDFVETDAASLLRRSETLHRLQIRGADGACVVTYPEALAEKVASQQTLAQHTFAAQVGEKVSLDFLVDLLRTYDFTQDDFVYEPGQFAVRGGIVDVYAYASELPYRIELVADEIASLRTFDPESQLSKAEVQQMQLVPNLQKVEERKTESFLSYLPDEAKLWLKDYQGILDALEQSFHHAQASFEAIQAAREDTPHVEKPEDWFETSASFEAALPKLTKIEFGKRFYFKRAETLSFQAAPQPSFNKNFELMVENFSSLRDQGYTLALACESEKALSKLYGIFEEMDPSLAIDSLMINMREGFIDHRLKLACYTDHQLFERFHRYKTRKSYTKSKAMTLKELRTLHPGDYVVHVDYGVGRFAGLDAVEVNGNKQEAVRLVYRDNDLLYISIHSLHKISKYSGKEAVAPKVSKLGSPDWEKKKKKISRKVKDIAKELIALYAKRKASPGFSFAEDSYLEAELETSFLYEDTPDQAQASEAVKADMHKAYPMDRLVCGDVGFGKTEIAIRAAFKAAVNGKQVAVLVPTTVLAMQHYRTFSERMANFPVKVEYINRFRTSGEIKSILTELKAGKVDILIGTHRIVNKDVVFKDMGLLIIDEEQKFGVKMKDQLKALRVNVDTLTLTATPIPRTLHFSLMGARDLSLINTPPPNRQPVTTEIHTFNKTLIKEAIGYEFGRGGQVFFVHNRVSDIEHIADMIQSLVPKARLGVVHGQMDGAMLEKAMLKFIERDYDVLVSTNIIESGLDIPNANTILINNAQHFGLSDLHQMRGRVGRSNTKAFCFLMTPPVSTLSSDSRKRLNALEEFSELGDGFKVAMRDLDIRGAGNLLGGEQSGFIADMGYDLYHKILDEAVQDLKENEFKGLFESSESNAAKVRAKDTIIETDLEILIPEDYIKNVAERLNIYTQIDNIKSEADLQHFTQSTEDKFGKMPQQLRDLFHIVKLRWLAMDLGFEKLTLKSGSLRCYFPPKTQDAYFQSSVFQHILTHVQQRPEATCQLKEVKDKLILRISQVATIQSAWEQLSKIQVKDTRKGES